MAFEGVPADAYERFMGRFSTPLAPHFADAALTGLPARPTVLDVGCGPGMLTAELARRTDEDRITAVDPMPSFVAAAAARFPRADVRAASAEALPLADGVFDAALAQLVVHFMSDPVAGLREMARVTGPGGVVAACVWDGRGGTSPLSLFGETARRLDPVGAGEPGNHYDADRLATVLVDAGVQDVSTELLTVTVGFRDFEEWWAPFTENVGPAGTYVTGLDDAGRARLTDALRAELGDGPFELTAGAWSARGTAA